MQPVTAGHAGCCADCRGPRRRAGPPGAIRRTLAQSPRRGTTITWPGTELRIASYPDVHGVGRRTAGLLRGRSRRPLRLQHAGLLRSTNVGFKGECPARAAGIKRTPHNDSSGSRCLTGAGQKVRRPSRSVRRFALKRVTGAPARLRTLQFGGNLRNGHDQLVDRGRPGDEVILPA